MHVLEYNGNSERQFDIDTTGFTFTKLETLFNDAVVGGKQTVHPVDGMFITSSKLGEQAVIIDSERKELVSLPMYMTDRVKDILADAEAVGEINSGIVGYKIYPYVNKYKTTSYALRFADRK